MIDFSGIILLLVMAVMGLTVVVCVAIYYGFDFKFKSLHLTIKSGRLAFERSRIEKEIAEDKILFEDDWDNELEDDDTDKEKDKKTYH